jgi:hypothetical protein
MSTKIIVPGYLQSNFYLTSAQRESCDRYYLLYWATSYYLGALKLYPETITRQDIDYRVHYLSQLSTTELRTKLDGTIKLSFRRQRGSDVGIVLVDEIYNTRN